MTAARGPAQAAAGYGGTGATPQVRLLPALVPGGLPEPDDDAAVVLARAAAGEDLVVLGAPGTGKSTTALHLLTRAVQGGRTQ